LTEDKLSDEFNYSEYDLLSSYLGAIKPGNKAECRGSSSGRVHLRNSQRGRVDLTDDLIRTGLLRLQPGSILRLS
jgi:hypothetical protein